MLRTWKNSTQFYYIPHRQICISCVRPLWHVTYANITMAYVTHDIQPMTMLAEHLSTLLRWDQGVLTRPDEIIGHVNSIPTMQLFTGISLNTQSKSYMISLTQCVWEFQNNALWDTHWHALWAYYFIHELLACFPNSVTLAKTNNTD